MNRPNLLPGTTLIELGAKKCTGSLPPKCSKDIVPQNSTQEKEDIEKDLLIKKTLITEERIEKRGSLSQGEWKEEIQKAIITDKKGPYWQYIGHCLDNVTFVYPEEALFLIEINSLLLKYDGVPVSVQQAYSILIGKDISLDEYRTYSQLMREGYKLLRHDSNRCKSLNGTVEIQQDSSVCKSDDKNGECSQNISKSEDHEENSNDCLIIVENDSEIRPTGKRKLSEDRDLKNKKRTSNGKDISNVEQKNKVKSFDMINCYRKDIVFVDTPPKKYLPYNICPQKPYYFYKKKSDNSNALSGNNERVSHSERSNTNRRRSNSESGGLQNSPNIFPNNTLFVNHVYQNISIHQTGFGMNLARSSSLFYFGNVNSQNNSPSRASQQCQTSKNSSPPHPNPRPNPFSRECNHQSNCNLVPLKPNPFSKTFCNSFRQRQRKKQEIQVKILEMLSNNDYIERDELSGNENTTKYQRLLLKIKKYKRLNKLATTQQAKIKIQAYLESILKKYNKYFHANLKINKLCNKRDLSNASESKSYHQIVQLSSDSDETNSHLKMDEDSSQLSDDPISMWSKKDSWGRSELPKSKPKYNRHLLMLNNAFYENIKRVDFDKNKIKNWHDLKQFCANIDAVSISDDEDQTSENLSKNKIEEKKNKTMRAQPPHNKIELSHTSNVKISYDVYKPCKKTFKKSDPPLPTHVLIIRNINSPVMGPDDFDQIRLSISSDVLILVAVVSLDNVFIMEMDNVELPTMTGDDAAVDMFS